MEAERITAEEVSAKLDSGEGIVFVDVRNPVAWSESDVKLPGAIRIPLDGLEDSLELVPRDRTIVTYCT